jgi:Flp pilus assembly protein TadB
MEDRPTTEDVLRKYGSKIEKQMKGFDGSNPAGYSQSYQQFRESLTPQYSRYERWCRAFGNLLKINASKKDSARIQKSIDIAHLNVTVSEVLVFAVMFFLFALFGGLLLVVGSWLLFLDGDVTKLPLLMFFLVVLFSIFLFFYLYNLPERLATKWRLKASSQMVPAILYMVIYMKHTSNFEKAVSFASQHLDEPLALDFKKIFWDVEVGRFSSVKDSVDYYLECWRDYSLEFIEAFHLIESSLYEPSESRRIAFLEKSLQVILDGVYDKMLKYTHNVKSPLTNLYMLGIVLPTLSLAILPLASTMLQGAIKWYHVIILFDLIIPFFVLYMTGNIIMGRPGGHGDSSLLEKNPLYAKYRSNKPFLIAVLIALPFFILGILPLLFAYTPLPSWLGMQVDYTWKQVGLSFMGPSGIFGITVTNGVIVGPLGILSLILSLFLPFSIALTFIIAYKIKTKDLIKEREKYKEVENEFTSSLFQLGNKLGDGMPAEIAFAKISESTRGTATEGFFRIVNENIQQLGMSVENALFNPRRGAVVFYPSHLVATSMRILIESSKKGLQVAARSLMSISDYVKNIRKIDDRLNDLLADILSDMKSNMTFLAPLLSGIIVGLSGMITAILSNLGSALGKSDLTASSGIGGGFGVGGFMKIFDVTAMIPPYWIQVAIGFYIIEVVFILTATLVTIKSGKDDLETTAETAANLLSSMTLYLIVALFAVIGLSLLGSVVLAGF